MTTCEISERRRSDPSSNVMMLVAAATQRIDDMRAAESLRVNEMREAATTPMQSETKHLKEMSELRAEHAKDQGLLESARLNAIRRVDVVAGNTAQERAAAQALVLAAQVAQSAETLRALVASTARSMAASQAQFATQMTERLAMVEKTQYENKGKDTGSGANWNILAVLASLLIALAGMASALYAITREAPMSRNQHGEAR